VSWGHKKITLPPHTKKFKQKKKTGVMETQKNSEMMGGDT